MRSTKSTRHITGRERRLAACLLASAIALSASACTAETTSPVNRAEATSPASRPAATAAASAATGDGASNAQSSQASGGVGSTASSKQGGVGPCGNADLKVIWGHGTQSEPQQYSAVIFTNVSRTTCTLRGFPGAAITVDGTVINGARELNGDRGDKPPLTQPPLVTIAPGASASAALMWMLHVNQSCYPAGTGSIAVTAPDTTKAVVLSTGAHLGREGICSSFAVTPVVPGMIGF